MNPFQRLVNYLLASKIELEKVVWPTKQDIIRYSSLVIIVSVAAAVFFGALDSFLHSTITAIIARRAPSAVRTTQTTPDIQVSPVEVESTPVTPPATTPDNNVITGQPATPNVIKP